MTLNNEMKNPCEDCEDKTDCLRFHNKQWCDDFQHWKWLNSKTKLAIPLSKLCRKERRFDTWI